LRGRSVAASWFEPPTVAPRLAAGGVPKPAFLRKKPPFASDLGSVRAVPIANSCTAAKFHAFDPLSAGASSAIRLFL
jgi:hypothetical protein